MSDISEPARAPGNMQTRSLRMALRDDTRSAHEALDSIMGGYDLSDPAGYAAFLQIHGAVLPAIEAELEQAGIDDDLKDWPDRRRRDALSADLAELGLAAIPAPSVPAMPDFSNKAARLGATYVLEGSRLGAKMLLRQVPREDGRWPTQFLSHGTEMRLWPEFVGVLDEEDARGLPHGIAIEAARHIFDIYQRAAEAQPLQDSSRQFHE